MTPLADVGLCLDVDGTVHRSGSVFVETLAALRAGDALPLTPAERRDLSRGLDAVADYRGGVRSRRRWRATFLGADLVRTVAGGRVAASAVARVVAASADGYSDDPEPRDPAAYRRMQTAVVDAYGRVLAGRDADTVRRAVEAATRYVSPDDDTRRALRGFVGDGAAVHLVSDVPAHVVAAYAAGLTGRSDWATGTRFSTEHGRYTGAHERVEKGRAVADWRAREGWSFVVAAGDTDPDLAMRDAADVFLAVAGQGALAARIDADIGLPADREALADALEAADPVVLVPRDVGLGDALTAVLDAAGYSVGNNHNYDR